MHEQKIREIMLEVADKKLKVDDAVKKLKFLPFEDLGYAKIDHHRSLRKGFPEVVYCQNKSAKQVVGIVKKLAQNNSQILATRATEEMFKEVRKNIKNAQYNKISKTIIIRFLQQERQKKLLKK